MTRTPKSVRYALLVMGGLILSQAVGVRRVEPVAETAVRQTVPVIAPAWAATESLPVASAAPPDGTPAPGDGEVTVRVAEVRYESMRVKACGPAAHRSRPAPNSKAGAASIHPERRAT
jgi:hypothetical protein